MYQYWVNFIFGFLVFCWTALSWSTGVLPSPEVGTTIKGRSYSIYLTSPVTGEKIAATVHEPTSFTGGQKYPLILAGHSWGFSRSMTPEGKRSFLGLGTISGDYRRLLDAGYGVLTFDQRGWGESGGTITVMDPDRDGKNILQILDWAEANLDWLAYRDNNLLLGAVGGSYGGGFQYMLLGIDPKKRLDAIIPQIAWHDLNFSMMRNGVPKSFWGSLLFDSALLKGKLDSDITRKIVSGGITNTMNASDQRDMAYRGLNYFCDGVSQTDRSFSANLPPKVDAWIWQGAFDTLFNVNEAYENFKCLNRSGGDVRLYTYPFGHVSPSGGGFLAWPFSVGKLLSCGPVKVSDAEVLWFNAKLKNDSAAQNLLDHLPKMCLDLDNKGDAIAVTDMPVGGTTYDLPSSQVGINFLGSLPKVINLGPLMSNNNVLAGVPKAQITLSKNRFLSFGEPIIFVALGKNGLPINDQITPVRGYGTHTVDLGAVGNRLKTGDQLQLLYYGTHYQYGIAGGRFTVPFVTVNGKVSVPLLGDVPSYRYLN